MRSSYGKSTLIGLVSYGVVLLILYTAQTSGFPLLDLGKNNLLYFLFFSFFRTLLSLLRNTQDQNTKYLKTGILISEIYIIVYLIIKPYTNVSSPEFLIRYMSGVALFFSATTNQKSLKILLGILGAGVNILMRSINFLMIYRHPAPVEEFFNLQEYTILISTENTSSFPSKLELKNEKNLIQTIRIENPQILTLKKDENYTLTYESQSTSGTETIFITSPSGEALKLLPQSKLTISTLNNHLQYTFSINSGFYFPAQTSSPFEEITTFQETYQKNLQTHILKSLPPTFQYNKKLQKLSYEYTKRLSTFFGFYLENLSYAKGYLPFFERETTEKTGFYRGNSDRSSLKTNLLKGRNKSETKTSLKNISQEKTE